MNDTNPYRPPATTAHAEKYSARSVAARLASYTLLIAPSVLAILTVVTFAGRVAGRKNQQMPIRSMVGPKEPAVEIGDASWYTAILVFSSIVVWVGLRSTQGKIPIAGCIATVILSMLIIETNAAPIVSPLTIAAVAILVYGGYIKPRFFPQRLVTGEPADARETSAQSVLKSKSTPRSP